MTEKDLRIGNIIISVFFYTKIGWFCVFYPFVYIGVLLFILNKIGLLRHIRSAKRIKFDSEHDKIGVNSYLSESYYRNIKTGEIITS